jgi:hypothetical protein
MKSRFVEPTSSPDLEKVEIILIQCLERERGDYRRERQETGEEEIWNHTCGRATGWNREKRQRRSISSIPSIPSTTGEETAMVAAGCRR